MHCHAPGRLHANKKVIVAVLAKTMLRAADRAGVALKKRDAQEVE
jgi:ribosomal protein S7